MNGQQAFRHFGSPQQSNLLSSTNTVVKAYGYSKSDATWFNYKTVFLNLEKILLLMILTMINLKDHSTLPMVHQKEGARRTMFQTLSHSGANSGRH
jgi:hypothetical protein